MERVSPEIVPQRKLSNGMVIPGIGMGTFGNDRYTSEEVSDAVYGAIEAGYRLFDCAASYGNEAEIGKVFAKAFAEGIVHFLTTFVLCAGDFTLFNVSRSTSASSVHTPKFT